MIDKKPFKVTNEQAVMDRDDLCGFIEYTTKEKCTNCKALEIVKDYASDLLDARDLIDKHEAIIKEMHKLMIDTKIVLEDASVFMSGEKYNDPLLNELLDKTKDYA